MSQEVSPFKAGDHTASINRRARKHNKNKTEKCHWEVTGVQFFRLQIWTEISHSLGLQKSTANQIRLNEIVVLDMWQPKIFLVSSLRKRGILGQVWYLIVSIPDLCTITYFHQIGQAWNFNTKISIGKSMCCCFLVWAHYWSIDGRNNVLIGLHDLAKGRKLSKIVINRRLQNI